RIPAAVCGVVGLRPTYDRVSRKGAIPLAWSLDHVGPITKTVADAAIFLSAIAADVSDIPCSRASAAPIFQSGSTQSTRDLRVGIPKSYFFDHVDPENARLFQAAIQHMGNLGMSLIEIDV